MDDQQSIKDIVEAVLSRRFEDVNIVSVYLEPEKDWEGDDVLNIVVVFDARDNKLDPRKTSGFLRHLLPEIRRAGVTAFPVMSYIAESEWGKSNPAAA